MFELGDLAVWVRDGVAVPGTIVAHPDADHVRLLLPSGSTAQPFCWNVFPADARTPAGTPIIGLDVAEVARQATAFLLTKQPIREKIRLLRTQRPTERIQHGISTTIPTAIEPTLGRGRLTAFNIPERLANRSSPKTMASQFERYLIWATRWAPWRVELLLRVLSALEGRAPRQAEVYHRCVIGGVPWQDPVTARLSLNPQKAQDLAFDLGQYPSSIANALRRANSFIIEHVDEDPRPLFESLGERGSA